MSSPKTGGGKTKVFDLELPSSEDSFAPSETSEKYEDVLNSDSSTRSNKDPHKERPMKRRPNASKKSSSSSSNSRDSNVSNTSNAGGAGGTLKVTEGVQTDEDYLERLSPRSDLIDEPEEQILIPKRHVLLLMIFLGFINIYAMRVNLNVAIVAMVNNKTIILPTGDVKKIVSIFNQFVTLLLEVRNKSMKTDFVCTRHFW